MKNNRHNCKLILEHDPLLKDVFRHNILTEQTDIVKPVWWERISPAFTDMDLNYIMLYLEETYGLTMDKIVQKSIVHQADRNKYHPVRDYLNSLQWDGQERIRYVLHHFLGSPVDDLTYESMKMFLLGAIARAFRPGIKFEYMLCLVGGQGVGKSTFFRFMAVKDDWFTDDIGKLDSEKVYCQLRGHWMIEMSEMVATARSKSIEETKSLIGILMQYMLLIVRDNVYLEEHPILSDSCRLTVPEIEDSFRFRRTGQRWRFISSKMRRNPDSILIRCGRKQ